MMKNKKIKPFFRDYLIFKKFLIRQKISQKINNEFADKICIVVTPWMGTAVPWYSITIALFLIQKKQNIFILLDDMPFGSDLLYHEMQVCLILRILKKIKVNFKLLSNFKNSKRIDKALITKLSNLNSIHFTKGETNLIKRGDYKKVISSQLSNNYIKQEDFFSKEIFSQIIVPGGIWGSSGIYVNLAKKNKIEVSTFDSGPGLLLFSISGVAAQLKDIPCAFNKIITNQEEKQFAIKKGKEQLEIRRDGKDIYRHFSNNSSEINEENGFYLMLLNSVWDSAALGLHSVYNNMIDWILDSIEWVLHNSNKTIIIRQHPAESDELLNNTDSYEKKIKNSFGENKRVVFIEAKSNYNTYDLIERSICILGFSSSSIVESVALGKPAIIVSSTYYANLEIVYSAKNMYEYYNLLGKTLNNELIVTKEMEDYACICNYLTQSCNWYRTEFTPIPSDFIKWTSQDIEDISKSYLPIKAILNNIPLSILQHNKIYNSRIEIT